MLEFLNEYCNTIQNNSTIWGFSARRLFESISIYIMPIINPYGVDLVTGTLPSLSQTYQQVQQIANNFPDIPFVEGWKTNIRGVDLNLQFPAGWQNTREIKYSQGEVIFWQFQNYNPPNAFFICNQLANISGYSLENTPFNSSFAGYKD